MLNDRLRTLRMERKMSQKALAEEMHVSPPTITRYENGNMFPDYEKLYWLCRFFNVSADYLLGFSNSRLPFAYTSENSLSKDEQETLLYYRRLPREDQNFIKGKMIETYREIQHNTQSHTQKKIC